MSNAMCLKFSVKMRLYYELNFLCKTVGTNTPFSPGTSAL